jgi:hypothetical protein
LRDSIIAKHSAVKEDDEEVGCLYIKYVRRHDDFITIAGRGDDLT